MSRYSSLLSIYGLDEPALQKLQSSRLLIVGAGGIGCEILKNVALLGFKDIELIDLDTIDVSNLNRQFLFRPEHVNKPKALIAAEAAMKFNSDVVVKPHHANIKDSLYGISYFRGFHVVLNALDNIDARRHVNRLCLAANVPLIDSGTTGFLGQVMPIIKGKTSCYECKPKPTQKVYPICTIRSTPDKPVHTIVWAKELYKLLVGNASESMLFEDTAATGESSTYMHLIGSESLLNSYRDSAEKFVKHIHDLVVALFHHEIVKRIEMGVYATAKSVPTPVDLSVLDQAASEAIEAIQSKVQKPVTWESMILSVKDSIIEIVTCLYGLTEAASQSEESLLGRLSFDKDDDLAMRLVFAASNIRSSIFGIPLETFHSTKGIAGNIIPAISTTNAIVASIQVLQAVKVLLRKEGEEWKLPHVYCQRAPTTRGQYLLPLAAEEPEPGCFVCNTSQLLLEVDTSRFTLERFVKKVVKEKLGFSQPSVRIGSSCIYEEDEDQEEDEAEYFRANLTKSLKDCPGGGVLHDTIVSLSDYSQDMTVELVVKHVDESVLEELGEDIAAALFKLSGGNLGSSLTIPARKPLATSSSSGEEQASSVIDEDDDFIIISSNFGGDSSSSSSSSSSSVAVKRPAPEEADGQGKRQRVE